jgi:hypothetical protein
MKTPIILILMAILLSGCSKEDKSLDSGIITGLDPRDCMCCGGWFIMVNDSVRRFDQAPVDCTIDFSKVTYPLKVKVEWKKKDQLCLGDEIVVSKLILDQ